ncbi:hypothetical protein RHMOL_Rhmol04G0114000 [Rhododendron molle]|uniref:Uncharacterized protein n=1 Tax=Rhododendron molle TaxID=49168 RepID=A0ACC0P0H4_RHOML|nr:hypothetical protein RHMOL_Rhmol04G0114000 [Rhododendron molle]
MRTKVVDFINPSNQTWNLGRLRGCVSEDEVTAISKIPISCTKAEDKRVWSCNRSGKYSVKAGYYQAFKRSVSMLPAKASSSYSPPNSMWIRMWNVPTSPKKSASLCGKLKSWIACKSMKANRNKRWVPPPSSVIKFNCDGAYNFFRSLAAFGVIARDSGGTAQCWRALRIAVATTFETNIPEAIFESDCLEVIKAVTDADSSGPWEVSMMVAEIKKWAANRSWSFVWCCGEQNKVAHCPANFSLN